MKMNSLLRLLTTALLGAACLSPAATSDPVPASFSEAFTLGKFSLNVRSRYESVEQTALRSAEALTFRTRVGFTTAPLHGFKAMLEAEHIDAVNGDRYSQAGLNRAATGIAAVPDPEGPDLNQAWLAFTTGKTTATLGRQRLVYDNARFIGDSGWRQNMQTFDGLTVQNKSVDKLTLNYAYLDQINRVFGRTHAQGRWQSDSHLFNAGYSGLPVGTVTGYAYLLDFQSAAAQSAATYGASFAGTRKLNAAVNLTYRAEIATQSDYGASTLNYRASYGTLEAGLAGKPGGVSLGHEILGSGSGQGFRTPLATLHAFNGWADLFLTTPAAGLRDSYVKVALNLPAGLSALAFYHRFAADRGGARLGDEFDAMLTRKFGKAFTGVIKYADFSRDSVVFPNVRKLWLQVEFNH